LIVSCKTLAQSVENVTGGYGVQVSIRFSPYGTRDEAGLYLWLDPLNYIKIIVEGPRRCVNFCFFFFNTYFGTFGLRIIDYSQY
jgi:hypothetical protein